MTFSIIIPVYNVAPYLRECLDSILAQTYTDWEAICVDDGSTDGSGAILDEYAAKDKRFRVMHQENEGAGAARNAGLDWVFANSKSSIISFLDSDDVISSKFFEELNGGFSLGCDIVGGGIRIGQQGGIGEKNDTGGNCEFELIDVEKYWVGDRLHNSSCGRLYRRSLFQNIRYPEGVTWEDEYVIYRVLFSVSKIALTPKPYYAYRERANSATRSLWTERNLDSIAAMAMQCEYFQNHEFNRAFEDSVAWLNRLSGTAIEHWHQISRARRRMIRCELNRVKVGWIVDPWQYRNMMLLRNPIWARIVFWVRHVFDFVQRRGILGGVKYLLCAWSRRHASRE